MYRLMMNDLMPDDRKTIKLLLKECPLQCRLLWVKDTDHEPSSGYSGPATKAPDGVYPLYHPGLKPLFADLVVVQPRIIFDGTVVFRHPTLKPTLPTSIMELLKGTERRVLVFGKTGNYRYEFVLPEQWKDTLADDLAGQWELPYVGEGNLITGEINR
jgi:hypothetical protein